jgi:LmbE family N-acetylglucosaminyl deacetylase
MRSIIRSEMLPEEASRNVGGGSNPGPPEARFSGPQGCRVHARPGGALNELWNGTAVRGFVSDLLRRGKYQFVFTLLPDAETHGHHQAATPLAWKAVESQAPASAVFGGLAGSLITLAISK